VGSGAEGFGSVGSGFEGSVSVGTVISQDGSVAEAWIFSELETGASGLAQAVISSNNAKNSATVFLLTIDPPIIWYICVILSYSPAISNP
jgi:hypothetical protein